MAEVTIGNLALDLQRKPIKNLHISVLPPDGKVRVSAPLQLSDTAIRMAVVKRLAWIRQQQADFAAQPRQSEREMCSGETHYLWGRGYRLDVVIGMESSVKLKGGKIVLAARQNITPEKRQAILQDWYRTILKKRIEPLMQQWQQRIGVEPTFVGIKRMKTKWGSCNPSTGRIWLNLELVKKPPECLEFIIVHELIHLLERHHNERFNALMRQHLPKWAEHRRTLNRLPLAFDKWGY
ncbi:M48 family metallopeptidase [Vibrio fluvialis]|uniref:M48 family metallopeptidase n=1 Tax=Vibrio fluvialis TaxID=676 RepID=UPI001EECB9BD|nr:SprT family zinc-dependent metalloprotease [Vibrio fluvialis]EGQ9324472.1 M48 family metallopeptidase [Vibrio cholerae]EGR0520567.1 M48 family metallopeptidase [Vibrio cholerae]EHD7130299.1 M48 family metallopeptidase [Vibrio cholerae]EKC3494661.1 M48 family metallopeptidase [Vibrio cholerae]EKZ8641424.1 M48 family metallopeptidase [Vibrio cholerae]